MNGSLDWLFWLIGGGIAAGALVLLLWSLFWDRSRTRRRCPRCWYDMAGVPGLRCPECGREARNEKTLRRTRRRWRWGAAAALLLVAGVAAAALPAYRHGGWTRLVPSTILSLVAPVDAPTPGALAARFSTRISSSRYRGRPPLSSTLSEGLCAEAWRRIDAGSMADFQARWFVRRYIRRTEPGFDACLELPPRWPEGEPIAIRVDDFPLWELQFAWVGLRCPDAGGDPVSVGPARRDAPSVRRLPIPTGPLDHLRIEVAVDAQGGPYISPVDVPCRVAGSVETLLDPVQSPAIDQLVAAALDPRIVDFGDGEFALVFRNRSAREPWPSLTFAIAYRLEVRQDGRTLGRGVGAAEWERPLFKDWDSIPVEWADGGLARALAGGAEIAVEADRAAAARQYMTYPFLHPRPECWSGSFVAPLTVTKDKPW